jgi:hypothetical protein
MLEAQGDYGRAVACRGDISVIWAPISPLYTY